MKSASLFFIIAFFHFAAIAQPSDFIVLKKNNQTIKSFFAGTGIALETIDGSYAGLITSIKKDSVFLNQYDIRQVPTSLGVYILDTAATYRIGFNYKDIIKIYDQKSKGFNKSASGGSLFGGGILLTVIGLGTWIFTKPGTQYHASPYLIAAGAAAAGTGYLLLKSGSGNYTIGKKYHLQYIQVK